MKLSLKVQDSHCSPAPPQSPPSQLLSSHQKQPETRPLLLRAKIPITIFNLPFLSGFSTATHHPSDLTLSLATNFSSGPNLKLAYTAAASSSAVAPPPLTLTLKSGIGVYGSPKNSPLIISANFSFSPHSPNPSPTFSLLLKPNLGSFSLKKATSSNPNPSPKSDSNSFGFVPLERPMSLKDFSFEDYGKDSILRGISVMARTEMPVTKKVSMNCRWGVNFPEDLGKQMPNLTLNKIGISRVDEVKEVEEKNKNKSGGEVELLKGMCFWMKRELDNLQRENREMKLKLEEMKMGHLLRTGSSHGGGESIGKKVAIAPVVVETSSSGFEQWRNKKNGGGDNGKKEGKKNVSNGNRVDVESELQKAIKAASSSSSS